VPVGRTLLGSLVAAGALLVLASSVSAQGGDSATARGPNSRVVLAYYYAWWEPERIATALFTPAEQVADGIRQLADDPALVRRHIQQAQSAGIDGFIVNRPRDLDVLLPLAHDADFSIALQVDASQDPASQVRAFYTHIHDPGLVRYGGQPVLFFWRASALPHGAWDALREDVDPDHTALWIADGDRFAILSGDAWDGISPYAIAWSADPRAQLPRWAATAHASAPAKLFIPPVSPGCDDHLVRATTCVQDRADGAYYRAAWDGALAANPDWAVVVSTWNEWLEASQIEPALQYGDLYLRITRQYAETFKGRGQVDRP
jgi:Glycosyl hydrolase family 99